jgi:SAM-dependent methyltransferase
VRKASKIGPLRYVYTRPTAVSFTAKGLLGYSFGPLHQDVDIYFIEVEKGHDSFMVSKKITRTYYILSGSGHFTINSQRYDVSPGMLVEVPPKVEYSYSGKMTLFAFARPHWFSGNDKHTRWNPDVVGRDAVGAPDREPWLARLARMRIFGKAPVNLWLRLNQGLWRHLPESVTSRGAFLVYGRFLHACARVEGIRAQAFSTYFLRNRPQLELIQRLAVPQRSTTTCRVAVLGCSTGAEAYSVAWSIRRARPDLKLTLTAVDISKQAVEFANRGIYSRTAPELSDTKIFDRMTAAEIAEFFDRDAEGMAVKPWIREGIQWYTTDVGDPSVLDLLGPQDVVIANNFLCHMKDSEAEKCLRNFARLVRPGGYLFVSGVDLDVRTRVARDLGWEPIELLLEEIHEGDGCLRPHWPCHYGGLEPLDKRRRDWKSRYACAFRLRPEEDRPPLHEDMVPVARSRS